MWMWLFTQKFKNVFFEKLFCENLNILENKNGRRNCLERVSLAINGQRWNGSAVWIRDINKKSVEAFYICDLWSSCISSRSEVNDAWTVPLITTVGKLLRRRLPEGENFSPSHPHLISAIVIIWRRCCCSVASSERDQRDATRPANPQHKIFSALKTFENMFFVYIWLHYCTVIYCLFHILRLRTVHARM